MHDWLAALALKAAGAAVGASLAAWWRRAARRGLQVISGAWFGAVTGGWLIDFFEWDPSPDYLLMAGSIMGLLGYSLMEAALALNWAEIVRKRAR
jgi:hypothetical protein